jgi:hypothetical protein
MATYNRIGLKIPEQSPPKERSFYLNEKETTEWVESLPLANVGETCRQLFQVLHEFNRTRVAYKKRLSSVEKLREPVSYVGSILNKHYIDVGFPLSDKAHRIAVLNRELHNGLAIAYKSVISDIILTNQAKSEYRLLTTALHRAVHHLSRMMLCAALAYDNIPKRLWLELHVLHRLACRYEMEIFKVKDPLEADGEHSSIDQAYRRVVLFCLASPYKIRQRENLRVFEALLEWSRYTRFYPFDAAPTDANIIIQQNSDIAPCHGSLSTTTDYRHLLKLDISRLIHKLREQFDANPKRDTLKGIESLDKNLIRQLIQLWSTEQKRSFVRTKLNFELRVAVGIGNIYRILQTENKPDPDSGDGNDPRWVDKKFMAGNGYEVLSRFTLEPLDGANQTGIRRNDFEDFGPVSRDPVAVDPIVSIWNTPENRQRLSDTFLFQTINESAGGYCLDWRGIESPRILVGELIGIQSSRVEHQFGIGLVRWMKSHPTESMRVGVQMIAPTAKAVTARNASHKRETAQEALLLPEVATSGQPASLICPTLPFKVGHQLIIEDGQSTREIKLTRLLESSGAVCQFQFIRLDKNKPGIESTNEESGHSLDFDNLWSTL